VQVKLLLYLRKWKQQQRLLEN